MANKILANWEKEEKDKARNFAMQNEGRKGRTPITVFSMTASKAFCIKKGLKNGTIKPYDFIIAIDNDIEVCKKVKKVLSKIFKNLIVICADVRYVNLISILKGRKIDLTFLDLCGTFNKDIFHNIYKNRECFADNSRFGLTISATTRRKGFENILHKEANKTEYADILESLLFDSKNNLTNVIKGKPIEVKSKRQKIKKNGAAETLNVIKSIKASCYGFLMAMNDKVISINKLYRYKESNEDGKKHQEMAFIDFRFNGSKKGDNITQQIYDKYYSQKIKKTKKVNNKRQKITCALDIYKALKLYEYPDFESVPYAKKSWITIHAKKANKKSLYMVNKIKKMMAA